MRNLNIISTQYTGNTTIPADRNRGYLMIVMLAGATSTVTFGGGTGALPVTSYYEPYVVPSSELVIVTTGSFVVLSNTQGV